MRYVLTNFYLLLGCCQDLKSKSITHRYLWLGGIIGLVLLITDWKLGQEVVYEWIFRYVPGVIFLLYGSISREKIGFGDGWIVTVLGGFCTWRFLCQLLIISLFLTVIAALLLIILKKGSKESRIPYLPFLWAAHTILWIGGGNGN